MSLKFPELLQKFLLGVVVLATVFSSLIVSAADNSKPPLTKCSDANTNLTISALFNPVNFTPLVPDECSKANGGAAALDLDSIPIIIVRSYGLIASIVFYLFVLNLIFASVRYSYGAFQEGESSKALQMIQESGVSIGLVLIAHTLVSTLFSAILGVNLNTDVKSFQQFFN